MELAADMTCGSHEGPTFPSRRPSGSVRGKPTDFLTLARTHEALAISLADKGFRLPHDMTPPSSQFLRRMARGHRIRALRLRGQAARAERRVAWLRHRSSTPSVREVAEGSRLPQDHGAAVGGQLDQSIPLELGHGARDALDGQSEVVGYVGARHR